jgi:hypothetical protein
MDLKSACSLRYTHIWKRKFIYIQLLMHREKKRARRESTHNNKLNIIHMIVCILDVVFFYKLFSEYQYL